MSNSESHLFLSFIQEWFQNDDRRIGDNIDLESVGISSDGAAVILFRYRNSSVLYGRRFELSGFTALTNARDTKALAWEAIGEISEPSGPGQLLNVDWAAGLSSGTSTIRWVGQPIN
jgi:hypothetical protein